MQINRSKTIAALVLLACWVGAELQCGRSSRTLRLSCHALDEAAETMTMLQLSCNFVFFILLSSAFRQDFFRPPERFLTIRNSFKACY